jgi:hypothetical protein
MAVDVPAGGQSVILALDKKLIIDGDDNAKFVEVRWGTNAAVGSRSIPWMSDVVDGLVSIVGVDKLDVSYIPAENKLIVHTDRLEGEQLAAVTDMLERFVPGFIEVAQYNHNMEVSWRELPFYIPLDRVNKYDSCVNSNELNAVDSNFQRDFYQVDGKTVYAYFFSNLKGEFKYPLNATVDDIFIYAPLATRIDIWGYFIDMLGEVRGNLNAVTSIGPAAGYRLTKWRIKLPSLRTGDKAFNGKTLDKEAALIILKSIPPWTDGAAHLLTLGIHVDHKTDDEVLAAIANAESKGWKMTVQWNPNGGTYVTPAAATYGLRKPPIYAKVGEIELPDGTTERVLDWGHYVTNWEERGYEQFRSLESAYEYFNLPMPEVETEEELQIEEIENA